MDSARMNSVYYLSYERNKDGKRVYSYSYIYCSSVMLLFFFHTLLNFENNQTSKRVFFQVKLYKNQTYYSDLARINKFRRSEP
jgi:hypothetical protein